jgi:CHAT domain-containing protein
VERLGLHAADDLPLVERRPPGALDLPRLPAGVALLEYYLREESGVVFVVTRRGIEAAQPLAAGARKMRRIIRSLHLTMDASANTLAAGHPIEAFSRTARDLLKALYAMLVAPVAGHIAAMQSVVVVPYGPLHGVPFAALNDGSHYLAETHTVSTCPSSKLLRLCAARPMRQGTSALVLGNSNGGQLPYTLREAETVGRLLGGELYLEEQATRTALARAADAHPIIHLAAHGEARLDNPQFGYVQLADGPLNTVDVFNLQLDGAIVTLSGCETGLTGVSAGDELTGLSRGFLHAGASTLIQSLWRVQDRATAGLMERFYLGLRKGEQCGTALRAAQLGVLEEHGGHPFFWAPFQLVGDAERLGSDRRCLPSGEL